MKTVKVRIAVAVDRKGGWCASGWDTKSKPEQYERDAFGVACENLEAGEAKYWVEAELQVPDELTGVVQGLVSAA